MSAWYPAPDAGLIEFLMLWAIAYAGSLALYLVFCGLFHWLNSVHPERRIQARRMKNQIAMEIRTSVIALAAIAAPGPTLPVHK